MVLRASTHGQRSRSPPRRPTTPPRKPVPAPSKPKAAAALALAAALRSSAPTKPKAAPAAALASSAPAAASASAAASSKTVGHFPLTNKEAEALLGLEGGYFLELARSSKAKLALIPKTETGTFEIQACGLQEDIKATRLLLSQVLNDILLEAGIPSDEGAAELATSEREMAEDGGDEVEVTINVPGKLTGVVISGRRPGEKGMGKSAGIKDLQDVTGAVLTVPPENNEGQAWRELLVLNARGTSANVEAAKLIIQERIEEWKDIVEEFVEAPRHLKAVIMKSMSKIEAATETMIAIQTVDGTQCFKIVGLSAKVSVAKEELQGFVDTTPTPSKGASKSQGKGSERQHDGKGKQSGERSKAPWQKK